MPWWASLLKATPAIVLAGVAFSRGGPRTRWLMGFAFLFAALGDFLLGYDRRTYFESAVTAFLVAQLLFAVAIVRSTRFAWRVHGAGAGLWVAGLAGYYVLLWPNLADLRALIGGYVAAIAAMAACAWVGQGPRRGWRIVGASLFVFSDALIAYARFLGPLPRGLGSLILLSYYAAIYSLGRGIDRESKLRPVDAESRTNARN